MTKFKQTFGMMITQNKALFDQFEKVHSGYMDNPARNQEEFNTIGRQVQDIVRRYENILCGHSETAGYGKFSSKLADKFHQEIISHYPKYDSIGLKINSQESSSSLKRIK